MLSNLLHARSLAVVRLLIEIIGRDVGVEVEGDNEGKDENGAWTYGTVSMDGPVGDRVDFPSSSSLPLTVEMQCKSATDR